MTSPMSTIRVVVVDDDPLVRAGLSMILGGAPDIDIVGEAGDGADGIKVATAEHPHVVLMDIRMPRLDGLEATRRLLGLPAPPRVIVLTTFDADEYVVRALADGASGFLLKDTPPGEIVDAIRKVARGETMLSPSVTTTLIRQLQFAQQPTPPVVGAHRQRLLDRLSDREREVAVAVGQGLSNADIAAALFMSVPTVKAHVSRVFDKLEVSNRVQVAIFMHDCGLV